MLLCAVKVRIPVGPNPLCPHQFAVLGEWQNLLPQLKISVWNLRTKLRECDEDYRQFGGLLFFPFYIAGQIILFLKLVTINFVPAQAQLQQICRVII